jgi:hypothetical protein
MVAAAVCAVLTYTVVLYEKEVVEQTYEISIKCLARGARHYVEEGSRLGSHGNRPFLYLASAVFGLSFRFMDIDVREKLPSCRLPTSQAHIVIVDPSQTKGVSKSLKNRYVNKNVQRGW